MNHTILLVEDNKALHEAVRMFLLENDYRVESAYDGATALKKAENALPDIVILDLGLPDITGETVCRQLKKELPQLPIIILTAKNTTDDIVHGLSIGADDYMSKPFAVEELLARINARLRGEKSDTSTLTVGDLTLDRKKIEVRRAGKEIKLTHREFLLLECLMLNAGRVLSRDMILSRAWSYATEVESRAVDVYIGYLRQKIDSPFPKKLIHSVRGFGYVLKT